MKGEGNCRRRKIFLWVSWSIRVGWFAGVIGTGVSGSTCLRRTRMKKRFIRQKLQTEKRDECLKAKTNSK